MSKSTKPQCEATTKDGDTVYQCELTLGHKEEAHVNETNEAVWAVE